MGTTKITPTLNGNQTIKQWDGGPVDLGPNWSKAQVSDYMGYGSFSGADIKVIVHYPKSINAKIDLDNAEKRLKNILDIKVKELEEMKALASSNMDAYLRKYGAFAISEKQLDITLMETELAKTGEESLLQNSIPTSKILGEVQSVSWSIFREKSPVRTLGSVYPRAYVRGSRTIGGTFVFTIFHEHVLHEILDLNLGMYNTGTTDHDRFRYTTGLIDQLPPLDISFIFANEYGAISHMGIWGVEFVQEGATFSIEDLFSESVVQYVARDLDPMRLVANRKNDGQDIKNDWSKTASSLANEKARENAHLIRRNAFI